MQDEMLSCRETRRQLASYLAGEPHPALAEHLTGFFFGDELKSKIKGGITITLPECTGVWWK